MKKCNLMCFIFLVFLIVGIGVTGCGDSNTITVKSNDDIDLSFSAEFYDNDGGMWYKAIGKSFNIEPNKVKEYYYNSDGKWTYGYELSSIMSVSIDDSQIDSCGSTILFADNTLQKADIEFDSVSVTDNSDISNSAEISTPKDLRMKDYIRIQYWWRASEISKTNQRNSKLIVIQSQTGKPICMYTGDKVTWSISENLPKTTEIIIDGHPIYIHRANFAIIDTKLLRYGGK